MGVVRPVVEAVRRDGDAAVRHYTRGFDGAVIDDLAVPQTEIDAAAGRIAPDLRRAIETAAGNIERFHRAQADADSIAAPVDTAPGVTCWRRRVPIDRVGVYVPGGSAPLFSSALMLGIPARIAGCRDVVMCTPPQRDGSVDPALLFAAAAAGVRRIFRIGGAQAIAAMSYGTETVPKVHKVFGPGNRYVTAAKQLAALEGVAIDMPAGPSELLLIADGSANPDFAAADLLSQAEHGADSQVVLVSDSPTLIAEIRERLLARLEELPRREIAAAALESALAIRVNSIADALDFSNEYAPEHLILMVADASDCARMVTAAGSVFIGAYSPEAAGDYATGTNHTLPTGGAAAAWSGLGVSDFEKTISFQHVTDAGLRALAPVVETMARGEGLDAHAEAVRARGTRTSEVSL
jgi:histidinol dehydrogenase